MDSHSPSEGELQTQVRQQEVVAELGQQALEMDDLDQLMHDVTVTVAETLDTAYCHVLELLPEESEFFLRQGTGWDEGTVGSATVPPNRDSQAGYTMLSEEPVIVTDLRTEDRFSGNDLLVDHDVVSGITVLIGSVDDPWGVLGIFTTDQRTFTEHDANFVQSVANVLASAIESERAETELEEIYGRISDAFFALDEEWNFTYLNERAHELINPDGRELVGKHVWDEFPAAIGRAFKPKYEQAMYEQETVAFEEYYPEPLDAWFEVRAYPSESGLSVYFRDVTERKERERELELFRNLLDYSTDAVFVIDPETARFLDVNDTACRRLGYPREELLDLSAPDVETGLSDVDGWRAHVEEVQSEGGLTFEGEHRRADGSTFPVEVNVVHATLDDEYVLAIARDVTERKEQERRLRESEQRYRTLAESFPNGIVTRFDENLRYTLAAGQALEDLPVSRDDVEGHTPREVWGDDLADVLDPVLEATLDGEADSVELSYFGREWVVHTVPISDDSEVFAGMTMAQDVTEQVEREAELERTLDLLERTERIADVGGWEVDPETREPYWSDHLFDLLDVDYDEQPTLDQALDIYHSEEDRATVENAVEEAIETGKPFDVVARFPRPSGDVGRLRVQGEPEVEDGEVVTLRGAVQDVTEQVEREEKLEELVEKLQESNERLEQFAYAASHDLQEPLRMVSSYLQLIERRYADAFDEDGREFLEFAVDGADRMREMIEGLLEYSRVETRGDPFEPVDLDAVLEDVREDLQVRIEETGAEITTDGLPRVEGDEGQLRQVFQNLLDNAIEYSGDEPPRIHVAADRDGDRWEISVSDKGIGIDPDDADRVFEVFQSLHSREDHSGTGIGLALVERIVERHGGDIWVESDPSEGATFSFTLPAANSH